MKIGIVCAVAVVMLSSCTSFNRILKSGDKELKYQKAQEYFDQGEYVKSMLLIEDLIPVYRGTNKSEQLYYNYAWCHYHEGDFYTASFYFDSFVETFPKSDRAEESAFYAALCSFYESPRHSLDQTETFTAIDNFQLFLERYPETEKRDTVNLLMSELREKLEKKDYYNARLYYDTEYYKSAVIALQNLLKDYPGTRYAEDVRFMILKARYELAVNSIEEKKQERLEYTVKAYQNYIDKFANSNRAGQAENLYKSTVKLLEEQKKKEHGL